MIFVSCRQVKSGKCLVTCHQVQVTQVASCQVTLAHLSLSSMKVIQKAASRSKAGLYVAVLFEWGGNGAGTSSDETEALSSEDASLQRRPMSHIICHYDDDSDVMSDKDCQSQSLTNCTNS